METYFTSLPALFQGIWFKTRTFETHRCVQSSPPLETRINLFSNIFPAPNSTVPIIHYNLLRCLVGSWMVSHFYYNRSTLAPKLQKDMQTLQTSSLCLHSCFVPIVQQSPLEWVTKLFSWCLLKYFLDFQCNISACTTNNSFLTTVCRSYNVVFTPSRTRNGPLLIILSYVSTIDCERPLFVLFNRVIVDVLLLLINFAFFSSLTQFLGYSPVGIREKNIV